MLLVFILLAIPLKKPCVHCVLLQKQENTEKRTVVSKFLSKFMLKKS